MRSQFHHVIDIAPTILEAAGFPSRRVVNGVEQHPIEGVSMLYSFDDADAPTGATTQYFEMFCNRGIYHEGWTAVTRHSHALGHGAELPASTTTCGSSTTPTDWSQAHDLAAEMPEKLAELQQLWLDEARKYNVLPLDDRRIERFNPDLAGRPPLVKGNTQLLFGGMGAPHRELHDQHQEQVACGHGGGRRAGQRRRGRDHRPGRRVRRLEPVREGRQAKVLLQPARPAALHDPGRLSVPPGGTRCEWSSPTTAADSAKAAPSRSTSTGRRSAKAASSARSRWSSPLTRPRTSAPTPASPVSDDYTSATSHFSGTVNWVQIDLGEDAEDADHLITPEERMQVAMARQ